MTWTEATFTQETVGHAGVRRRALFFFYCWICCTELGQAFPSQNPQRETTDWIAGTAPFVLRMWAQHVVWHTHLPMCSGAIKNEWHSCASVKGQHFPEHVRKMGNFVCIPDMHICEPWLILSYAIQNLGKKKKCNFINGEFFFSQFR